MVSGEVKLQEYINSLQGLTPQQKSQVLQNAKSFEDVSLMLKNFGINEIKGDFEKSFIKINSSANSKTNFENIWQNVQKNDLLPDFLPSFHPASSNIETSQIPNKYPSKQPEVVVANGNNTATTIFSEEKNSAENLKTVVRKTFDEKKQTRGNVEETYKNGVINNSYEVEYGQNGRLFSETNSDFDEDGALMLKKSLIYEYDKNGNLVLKTAKTYDIADKPVKLYFMQVQNDKGGEYSSKTTNLNKKGEITSTDVKKEEVIKSTNSVRAVETVYDADGKTFFETTNEDFYNKNNKKFKNHWTYSETESGDGIDIETEYNRKLLTMKTVEKKFNRGLLTDVSTSEGGRNQKTITEHYQNKNLDSKTIEEYDNSANPVKTTFDKYDKKGKLEIRRITEKGQDERTKDLISVTKTFGKNKKLLTTSTDSLAKSEKDGSSNELNLVYDKKNNLLSQTTSKFVKLNGIEMLQEQVKTNYKNFKPTSVEKIEPSDVEGEYNYYLTDESGAKKYYVKAQKDGKRILVTKSLESPDSVSTNYNYNADGSGNSSLFYKIKDKKGNTLMNISREYARIDETHAVSKINDREYRIELNGDTVSVYDVSADLKTIIDLKKMIPGGNFKIKNMIKSQPGDLLIGLSKEVDKIGSETDNGRFLPDFIMTDEKPSTIAHEYTHSLDSMPNRINLNVGKVSANKEFLEMFNEEKEAYKKNAIEAEQSSFSYLENPVEFVAESKMLTTTRPDKNWNAMRAIVLMKYFPKTLALANKKLEEIEQSDAVRKAQ